MASTEVNPNVTPKAADEPELHLLLAPDTFEPLYKSLFRGLDEFFFPKKLPPLKLESKPIPVKDIWGFYNYKKNGALGSTVAHVIVIALIIGATILGRRMVTKVEAKPQVTELIDPGDYTLKPAKTQAGGGGGGGDRDVLKASQGKLPKFSMKPQITPPAAVIRNLNPKLAVEPTVMVPPDIKVTAMNNMPNLGDPKSTAVIPSNGTGGGSGIGEGYGGGVGPGTGRGVGPGEGMGMGGGVYRAGRGVTPPRPIFSPDPEFSEEARKAKYQGVCTLMIVVDTDGRPTNLRVVNSLGMGLDEKALETVKTWRFEPGMKDGHPVKVEMAVEVDFHLY
ncbi:MAG: energy transducer TonB [Candidatus Sulfotelmatobacter sp.]